jgi:chaperonin GroEL
MTGSLGTRPAPDLPAGPRAALVVATTRYEDPELRQLRAPARDAEDLAEVLGNPDIGAFTVTQVIDADEREVRRAIDVFLSSRRVGDLVVVYLSCHGVLDRRNRLYFAASDTLKSQLGSTGIPSTWLLDQLEECRARRQVLVLDCCFSGAFAKGSKGDTDLDLERRLTGEGRGRAVLTASRAGEYSFEGQVLPGAIATGSVFTAGLVEGLRTGAADAGGDGYISVEEAFDYAYGYVQSHGASQTPQRWLYGGEGAIVLARSPAGVAVIPALLPEAIAASLDSPYPAVRIGAVNTLGEWLSGANPARALAAEQKLRQIADTDVPAVAAAARACIPGLEPHDTEGSGEDIPAVRTSTPLLRSRLTSAQSVHSDGKPLQAADRIARGVSSVSELIVRTLGPMGRKCVIQDQAGKYVEASDARTIAQHFVLEDPHEMLGVTYVQEMISEQQYAAYDGAATATVLACAMTGRAMEALRAGANPMSLKRGIAAAAKRVSEELSKLAKDVETKEQIVSLATTCTGDAVIGGMIADAMDKVSRYGVIAVVEASADRLELSDCYRIDAGYISQQFLTDPEGADILFEDPYILIVNSKVSVNNNLLPLLEKVVQSGRPLAIIANDVEGEALATLVVNNLRGILKSVAVRAPGSGDPRKAMLDDLAIATGGQVISGDLGLKLENANLDLLGSARMVIVTKDKAAIVDGAGGADRIADRVNRIRVEIENTDTDHDREKLQERLNSLYNAVALIKISATTEAALRQRRQLTQSAVSVAHEAVKWGLLPGGGTALLEVQRRLGTSHARGTQAPAPTPDEATGIAVVTDSLAEPLKQILVNAGYDPAVLADPITSWKSGTGFDVMKNTQKDMLQTGIIDSCWVVTRAVANAASLTQRLSLVY